MVSTVGPVVSPGPADLSDSLLPLFSSTENMNHASEDVVLGAPVHASPFHEATERSGCRAYGVYNGLRVPVCFESPEADYWRRVHGAALRDASSDCHVEVVGPDAAVFLSWLTATRMDGLAPGSCRQALLADEQGGVVGYPMILRLGEDRYWLAQDNPDLLPWIKGAALNCELDFQVADPQVATLALEGARAPGVLRQLPGGAAMGEGEVRELCVDGMPLVVSPRAGAGVPAYSLRLQETARAGALWEYLLRAGAGQDIAPSAHCSAHRVEAGQLSLAFDIDADNDPFELGLGGLVDLDSGRSFIGKAALTALHARGPRRRLMGVVVEGEPLQEPNLEWWPLVVDGEKVGTLRTAVSSPRLEMNIGLGLVLLAYAERGVRLEAVSPRGPRACVLRELPFTGAN